MQVLEVVGVITGLLCVWLAARENIWNWALGIATAVCYMIVFWHAKLYADAALQVFYVGISVYGWWNWRYGGSGRSELPVSRVRMPEALLLAAVTVASTSILVFLLRRFTDSVVPFWDALTTAMSLTAQYMLGRKLIENWWLWMAADVIYVALYIYKSLYLTAGLYTVFFGLCIVGLLRWQKDLRPPRVAKAEAAG